MFKNSGDNHNSGKIGGPCCEVSGNDADERASRGRFRPGWKSTPGQDLRLAV